MIIDKCAGSCNTLDDLSNKVCTQNEIEDLELYVFIMTTEINKSRTLTKHISSNVIVSLMIKNVTGIKITEVQLEIMD